MKRDNISKVFNRLKLDSEKKREYYQSLECIGRLGPSAKEQVFFIKAGDRSEVNNEGESDAELE